MARVREDLAAEPAPKQPGQVPGVVEMSVREHHPFDRRWLDRQRVPVPEPQLLEPPIQAAVNQQPSTSSRCFEPVTVRAAPSTCRLVMARPSRDRRRRRLREQTAHRITASFPLTSSSNHIVRRVVKRLSGLSDPASQANPHGPYGARCGPNVTGRTRCRLPARWSLSSGLAPFRRALSASSALATVPPVHKHVQEGAGEEQEPREHAQEMCPVFRGEENP